jgi:hypothetical protein
MAINLFHERDLLAFLVIVVLIDTYYISPEQSRLPGQSKLFKELAKAQLESYRTIPLPRDINSRLKADANGGPMKKCWLPLKRLSGDDRILSCVKGPSPLPHTYDTASYFNDSSLVRISTLHSNGASGEAAGRRLKTRISLGRNSVYR